MSYKRFGLLHGLLQVMVPISFYYYYRKHIIIRYQKIPKKTPIIFASNHQNTLMDPFVVAIASRRQTGFLARASAFRNPIIAKILYSLKMKPVYRPRDGMENLIKNDEVFKACYEVLLNNQSFIMFPEGSHDRTRHLRLFKKGFSRIALGAVEESNYKLKVKIFPIGLNYSDHLYQGGDILVIVGNPIDVYDYCESYKQNQPKAINELKKEVYSRIKELMIHIEDLEHYDLIDSFREIYRPEMIKRMGLKSYKLINKFTADKKTIEIIENYIQRHKEETNILDNKVKDYKQTLKNLKLNEKIFVRTNTLFVALIKSILLIILCPVFLFSLFNSFIPYLFLRYIVNNKIKDDHFYSAYKLAIGMFLFPVFYFLITIPVIIFFGIKIGILYFALLFITASISLYTRLLYRITGLHWNFIFTKYFRSSSYQNLNAQRNEIIQMMNEIADMNYKNII